MRLLGSVVVAVAVLVSGCAAERDKGSTLESQFAELMRRPDIETAAKRYEEMRTRISERLTAESLAGGWNEAKDSSSVRGCRSGFSTAWSEIDGDTAEVWALKQWVSPGNLPDDRWERAVEVVAQIAREYGFGQPLVVVNRPNDHEVSIKDGHGAEVLFGTAKNTILTVTTGCHLTVAAHQRGTPAPKPSY